MTNLKSTSRRNFLLLSAVGTLLPVRATASHFREITWDELIPPGVPYSKIIGEIGYQIDAERIEVYEW